MFHSEFFLRTTQELEYFFFCSAKHTILFQNLTLGYMTKTLNETPEILVTSLIKSNTDEGLVTETLETGLIKYNTDESFVTDTLETGLIKYNTDKSLVTETLLTGLMSNRLDKIQY